jgi:hypothetical protein
LQIIIHHQQIFFSTRGGRYKSKLLSDKRSVFDLSSIKERTLPEIFQLIGLQDKKIGEIKDLIDKRNNNLAHANGNITILDLERLIMEYISLIRVIQESFSQINQKFASDWIAEIQPGDDVEQFLETHFLGSHFSPRDFGDIIGTLLTTGQLDFDQWTQVANKGLEISYDQTILALQYIEVSSQSLERQSLATNILHSYGEESTVLSFEEARELDLV